MHRVLIKQALNARLALLVVLGALLPGCVTDQSQTTAPSYVHTTGAEFADGVVRPLVELMALVSAFYVAEEKPPEDRDALAAFAARTGKSIDGQRFRRLEFSEVADRPVVRVLVESPSSLSDTGQIVTSWSLWLDKSRTRADSAAFAVDSESHICIEWEPSALDSKTKSFLELVIDHLAKRPVSRQICVGPSRPRTTGADERIKQKLEERLDEIRRRQPATGPD